MRSATTSTICRCRIAAPNRRPTLLTQQFHVPAENLTSQGYGEQYLKEQTDGPSRINRRVTIRHITPLLNGGQASLPPPPPGTAPPR